MKIPRRRALKQHATLAAFLLVVAAVAIASPAFLTGTNLLNIVRQASVHGIMAVGMTFVILTGGIDLSVGSMLALAGILCATLQRAGWPVTLVLAATLLLGAVMGLVNGLATTKLKVTPFVVTLGTMSIARGIAHIATNSQPIGGFDQGFRWLGAGELFGLPVPIAIFLLTVLVAAAVLKRTRFGRYLYAIGGNENAARLSGIRVDFCTAAAYVVCGVTAALAGVVLTSRLNTAESIAGLGYELDVVASVVIGGASLSGGRGSVWGTLAGALLIGTINNGMNLLKISSYYQLVVKGAIIIAAAGLDRLREN
jgi:ribose/xylose/arabinose/galactoside ABC-type transport system permease subunit